MYMEKSPFVEIAKRVCPAVVTIAVSKDLPAIEGFYFLPYAGQKLVMPKVKNKKEKTKVGGGSGFVISEDGYVLTCNHVVGDVDADYTVIVDPEHKYPAKVLARDGSIDIGILKIEAKGLSFLEPGDSNTIELGEEVMAVGNPLGEFEDTLSAGIISGLSRKITTPSGMFYDATNLRGLIQTDAAINPGNSGGPLVDMQGKAIGINTAVIMGAQNIGFAIPINYAKKDLEEVMQFGKIRRPFLGIRYVILNKEISQTQKLPVEHGALILRENFGEPAIAKGSTADKAGLKEYDILLEADNKKITEENTLADILKGKEISQEICLKVLREGKEMGFKLRLDEKK
ncbi:MAG: trypsin-like peptidase domain-containing protein [bacterium]